VGGVYHSAYDTYEYYSRFGDPGFAYAPVLAKTVGRVILRMADADVPLERYGDFAETVSRYLDQVKRLAVTKREAAETQAKMLAANVYRLTDDPTKTSGPPTALKSVPHFNMAPLENAVDHLKRSAKAYDTALAAKGAAQSNAINAKLASRTELGRGCRPAGAGLVQASDLRAGPVYGLCCEDAAWRARSHRRGALGRRRSLCGANWRGARRIRGQAGRGRAPDGRRRLGCAGSIRRGKPVDTVDRKTGKPAMDGSRIVVEIPLALDPRGPPMRFVT
jgi:hypothetical protein